MSLEAKTNLEVICAQIDKKYGKGSVMKMSERVDVHLDQIIGTGSIKLDTALGIGGYKKGRIVETFGQESCICGDSFISYEVWKNNKSINHKGGSIKRLYERFHDVITENTPKQGKHLQINHDIEFYVRSVNDEGSIIRNRVLNVVKTGEKECIRIKVENGNTLIATPKHKFLTPEGYKPLSKLNQGDTVFIHNDTRRKERKHLSSRPTIMVKYHPNWPSKIVHDKKTNRDYLYYRGQKSRAVFEAFMNDMTLECYMKALNTWGVKTIDMLYSLPDDIHVHYIDEDFTNNNIKNLRLIDPREHGMLHTKDRHANLSFVMIPTKITELEAVGIQETFDLKCTDPYNNYITEGIVVHNSGKTTLCLHAIANTQKLGMNCVFIDAEHALDINYASALGVNVDELILAQPDYGEQALDIVDTFVRSGEVGLIVVDSVAALIPKKELEGEIGDNVIGLQARIMSQAMRKMAGPCSKSGCTVIFVNQIRQKIGVMFGCFHYDAKVLLANGTTEKIGKIVNQKIQTNVLSVSKNGRIEAKPITGWHKNGKADRFYNIIVEYPHGRGKSSIPVGDDHIFITPKGEEHAKDLVIGDKVYVKSKIHPKFRNYNLKDSEIKENHIKDVLIEAKIVDIYDRIAGKSNTYKFDITVDDNHCYFIDNTLVHNSPNVVTGGKALQFYASIRLEIKRIGNVEKKDKIIGNKTRVVVVKNKLAPPKREAEFNIIFGVGIDTDAEILDLATEDGIIQKKSSWYKFQGESIAQGEPNALIWLNENPETKENIRLEILTNRGIK
jgi:RecA/RadA recombinase